MGFLGFANVCNKRNRTQNMRVVLQNCFQDCLGRWGEGGSLLVIFALHHKKLVIFKKKTKTA